MAREEHPREDLIREATALLRRLELTRKAASFGAPSAEQAPIVCGFRAHGAFSIYFGEDPVYQFNSTGELRRAYRNGLLIKADQRQLASLTRQRTGSVVALLRHDFTSQETESFLLEMSGRLGRLEEGLRRGELLVSRQMPPDVDILSEVLQWLDDHPTATIAETPRVN